MQTQSPRHALSTSIKIPGELRKRLQTLAESRQRTPHAIMLQAIEDFVSREEKREAWRQEGIAAWEEYQRTGLHPDECRGQRMAFTVGRRPQRRASQMSHIVVWSPKSLGSIQLLYNFLAEKDIDAAKAAAHLF